MTDRGDGQIRTDPLAESAVDAISALCLDEWPQPGTASERLAREDPRARTIRPPLEGDDWNDVPKGWQRIPTPTGTSDS